jgi:parvulin-like peptidyl-prolyl isomerase
MKPLGKAAWLWAGAALGLGAALFSAFAGAPRVNADAIATVNGEPILRADYEQALAALEADKRNPLTEDDRTLALDRLIAEELLLQEGLEMGLGRDDPAARKAIVQAMTQLAAAEGAAREPTEQELRAYFEARPQLFSSPQALRVRIVETDAAGASAIAAALRQGASWDDATKTATPTPVPDRAVSPADIAQLASPAAREAALALKPGEIAGPIPAGARSQFVWMLERQDGAPPAFESVRPAVEAAWRRETEEKAFDGAIARMKRSARIHRTNP